MKRSPILLCISLFLFFQAASYAQDHEISAAFPYKFSSTQDTIFIKMGTYQIFEFEHTIAPKETLYSIAKFYGMSIKDLYFFNPHLSATTLSVGQKISIPLPKQSILRFETPHMDKHQYHPLCYKVKKGDTVYGIAKSRFKMPIDTLLERNSIITTDLEVGQVLHVGYMKNTPIPPEHHRFKNNPEWIQEMLADLAYQKGTLEKKEYKEHGAAFLRKDLKDSAGHAVLHRSAPLRSYITIKNPMNGRTIQAKVVGRIPDSVHTDEVIVVVSRLSASALGAKDDLFYVWIK